MWPLPLGEALATGVVYGIVSGSDGRMGGEAFEASQLGKSKQQEINFIMNSERSIICFTGRIQIN